MRQIWKSIVALFSLLPLLANVATARAQSFPSSYKIEADLCAADSGKDAFFGSIHYVIRETGERMRVELEAHLETDGRGRLLATFRDAYGRVAAVIEVSADEQISTLGPGARYLSEQARASIGTIFAEREFQRALDDCVLALKPWVKWLIKGLCLVAAGVCCGVATPACPACAAGAGLCAAAVDA